MSSDYLCLRVREPNEGQLSAEALEQSSPNLSSTQTVELGFEEAPLGTMQDGEVIITAGYSSLNYKDTMAAAGNRTIVSRLPHIPGIDAAGTIFESSADGFKPGDRVMVAHADFGTLSNGGFSQLIRVPADWVYLLDKSIDPRTAMIFGTAGFTAAASVKKIIEAGIKPEHGPVAVTGATGGVGSLAIFMLAKFGYETIAVTGKPESLDWLLGIGAAKAFDRKAFIETPDRPLLKGRFAAGVDTVGGPCLNTLIKSTMHNGLVTACGMVGGVGMDLTVFPFILRGVTLAGIDSANISRDQRIEVWNWISENFADAFDTEPFKRLYHEIPFADLLEKLDEMRNGTHQGRTLVRMSENA